MSIATRTVPVGVHGAVNGMPDVVSDVETIDGRRSS